MSKFWYFLGGCAAGALAVAAVQAFTDDGHSSCSSDSSSSDEADDRCEDHAPEGLSTEDSAEDSAVTGQGAAAMAHLFKKSLPDAGNDAPPPVPADLQRMSEQLTSSVIGIVSEFLRQSQAPARLEAQEAAQEAQPAAAKQGDPQTAGGTVTAVAPRGRRGLETVSARAGETVTPDFSAAQA